MTATPTNRIYIPRPGDFFIVPSLPPDSQGNTVIFFCFLNTYDRSADGARKVHSVIVETGATYEFINTADFRRVIPTKVNADENTLLFRIA